MQAYLLLTLAALLPVIAAVIFFLLEKYTSFNKINFWVKQIIFGVVFGGLAILGTHWGIPLNGAVVNSRDSCAIIAGLFFGWPAGIIAGLIGGLERYFGVYWFGLGSFTQVACCISTCLAGIAAAFLRKFMFKDKRAGLLPAFLLGFVIETFHLFMVFVTNGNDYIKAFEVVRACTAPMLLANSLSVLLGGILLDVLEYKKDVLKRIDRHSLNSKFQIRMAFVIAISFLLSTSFIYLFQNQVAEQQTKSSLNLAIADTKEEMKTIGFNESLNQHVGKEGFVAILDNNKEVVSFTTGLSKELYNQEFVSYLSTDNEKMTIHKFNNSDHYAIYEIVDNYYVIAAIPKSEADLSRDIVIYINTFLEIIIFGLIFIDMYFIIAHIVDRRLKKINNSLSEITSGNLDTVVDGGDTTEFKILSQDINHTVGALKGYIEEAKTRIDKELALAKDIQSSALPNVFPAFPSRKDIDIHAFMQPAKEVGGDFYDFYFTHTNSFTFLIADVSGKGIPGAMFMMRAKTELKSLTQTDLPINEVFSQVNNNLCKGNDAGMFVTAWQTNIDLVSGVATLVNAGHNPPLIKRASGNWEYYKVKPNMTLASFEDFPYRFEQLQLQKGDTIFLYTDGVTESINENVEQYGEERLLKLLNSKTFANCQEITKAVYDDVVKFVGSAEQFDDITMLAFTFVGK